MFFSVYGIYIEPANFTIMHKAYKLGNEEKIKYYYGYACLTMSSHI